MEEDGIEEEIPYIIGKIYCGQLSGPVTGKASEGILPWQHPAGLQAVIHNSEA